MGYDSVFLRLLKWEDQEMYFRDYALGNETARQALLARTDINENWKQRLKNPESFIQYLTEERLFSTGRNVALIRHIRYSPYFEHAHAFYELICVITGSCTHILEGREMSLKQGDFCLIAPDVRHGLRVFNDSVVVNILIRASTFMDIFLNAIRDKSRIASFFLDSMYGKNKRPYLLYHAEGDELLLHYILDMYEEQGQQDRFSDRIICSLLTIFFSQLTRRHEDSAGAAEEERPLSPEGETLMALIMSRYSSITLGELAAEMNMSEPACSRLIKEACGLPFLDLIRRIRARQAAILIRTTQLSVAEIGKAVGYPNSDTFSHAFSHVFSMTPAQYRQKASHAG